MKRLDDHSFRLLTLCSPVIRSLQFVQTKSRPLTTCFLTVRPIYNSFHLQFVPLQFDPYPIRSLRFVSMHFVPIFLSHSFINLISVIFQKQE